MRHFIGNVIYGLCLFGMGLAGIADEVTREDIDLIVADMFA